jgi:hypothetical protein
MRVHVSDPTLVDDLRDYLRRCNCAVYPRGTSDLDAVLPDRNVEPVYLRMELDAYLRVWRLMHPESDAVIVDDGPDRDGNSGGSSKRFRLSA